MKARYIKVAGVTFPTPDGVSRQSLIAKLRGNEPVRLRPEPENKFDGNAIAVDCAMADGTVAAVGYVPRELAKELAPLLDGENVVCEIYEIAGGFELAHGEYANYGIVIRASLPGDTTPPEPPLLPDYRDTWGDKP